MKLVYIAGPIRATNLWEREQNIRRAEELSLHAWTLGGVAAICPHTMGRFFDDGLYDLWIAGDLEILRRCDAILLTPDWRRSQGATREREEALLHGIPAFEDIDALRDWLDEERRAVRA